LPAPGHGAQSDRACCSCGRKYARAERGGALGHATRPRSCPSRATGRQHVNCTRCEPSRALVARRESDSVGASVRVPVRRLARRSLGARSGRYSVASSVRAVLLRAPAGTRSLSSALLSSAPVGSGRLNSTRRMFTQVRPSGASANLFKSHPNRRGKEVAAACTICAHIQAAPAAGRPIINEIIWGRRRPQLGGRCDRPALGGPHELIAIECVQVACQNSSLPSVCAVVVAVVVAGGGGGGGVGGRGRLG
jgi:hypothetical protein